MGACLLRLRTTAAIVAIGLTLPLHGQQTAIEALEEAFSGSYLEGFAAADAMFAYAYRAGDLGTMMAVIETSGSH